MPFLARAYCPCPNDSICAISSSHANLNEVPAAQPCYKWYEIPYYWAGLKAYDLVAGTQGLTLSRFTSASEAQRQFPTLAERRPNKDTLKGAVRYHASSVESVKPHTHWLPGRVVNP